MPDSGVWLTRVVLASLLVLPARSQAQVLPPAGAKTVFVGSVYAFAPLAWPEIAGPLLACGHVGVYWHGGSLVYGAHPAALKGRTPPQLSPYAPDGSIATIAHEFAGTGGGLAEMSATTSFDGPESEWARDYIAQDVMPHAANWSAASSTDPHQFQSDAQMAADIAQFAAMRAHGIATILVFATPDGPEPTAWLDPYWDSARELAAAGGGIAFDAPAGYALHQRGEDYRRFVADALRWAGAHRLQASLSLDTFSEDKGYRDDTIAWVRYLWAQRAYPTNYVVQSFNPTGAAFSAIDPNALNAVALWLCEHGLVRRLAE